MHKNLIVKIMCDVVNEMNFEIAQAQGANPEEAKAAIEQHQPQLVHVNTMILDKLIESGIVTID
jgi:hypothetical protein